MPKLLFISSNPDDNIKLRMDTELKEILNVISPLGSYDFKCTHVPAIRIEELPVMVVREKPDILHFSGHGDKRTLSFEKDGKTMNVGEDAIAEIFQEVGKYVNCMVLNACDSYAIAERLTSYIPYIISFPDKIEDELIEPFSKTFYGMLSLGQTIESSFIAARAVIISDIKDSKRHPKLLKNGSLAHHKLTIFDLPYIAVNFILDKNGPTKKNGLYALQFVVKNLPKNATYILYELIDQTIPEKYRFHLVNDLSAGNFFHFSLYGNVVVKAWFWLSDKDHGVGIQSTVTEGLSQYYAGEIPQSCRRAYDDITSN